MIVIMIMITMITIIAYGGVRARGAPIIITTAAAAAIAAAQVIEDASANRTSIMVAHKLSLIEVRLI